MPLHPILIVDDEPDNLAALARLLRHDFNVSTTESPFEALSLITKTQYSVVISDQRMPEMTGIDLLEKVKALRPNIIRVLLTGYTDTQSVIEAINRGKIYSYIAKPWEPGELKATLKQAADAYQLRKDLDETQASLERSNSELRQALEDLQALDRAKDRFLNLVSHELNTPLTSVRGFVELLQSEKEAFKPEWQKAIEALSRASDRLTEIIQDVVAFVEVEAEGAFHVSAVKLEDLQGQLMESLLETAKLKSVKLLWRLTQDITVEANLPKLTKGLLGLLEDTIQRAPSQSQIEIESHAQGTALLISIKRTGTPLPPESLEPMTQTGDPLKHTRNLGLKLAIAKAILERHRGSLAVSTNGLGFDLVLPLAK